MLAAVFCFKLPEISTSPIFLNLMRSFKVEVPVWLVCPPTYDLEVILRYLRSSSFELLSCLSLHSLPKKVSVLGFIGHFKEGKRVTGFVYSCLFLFFWCLCSVCSRICGQDRVGGYSPSLFFYYY